MNFGHVCLILFCAAHSLERFKQKYNLKQSYIGVWNVYGSGAIWFQLEENDIVSWNAEK